MTKNLREFLAVLRTHGDLVEIEAPVSPDLELAEIHRRVAAADGPALFFKNVQGSSFPVVTNLFGSFQRVEQAFPSRPEKILKELLEIATADFPPQWKTLWKKRHSLLSFLHIGTQNKKRAPVGQVQGPSALEKVPFLKSWPLDGGSFLTLPLVYTESPSGRPNLGMYRIQRFDEKTTGLHWQIGKGGGFHHHAAEKNNHDLPVSIFLGGPPALIMSAIAPLPENVSELLLASFLQGSKLSVYRNKNHPHPIPAECEFAFLGLAKAHLRRKEGPFGDHYGYYSWAHDFPVFHCQRMLHRKDAIYPATVVGKPRQEDFYIGQYLQDLLSPLFPIVMPCVKRLWSYGETGFHALSAAVVHDRFSREAMTAAFRILGEGQLSLTKFLLLTDQMVDVRDFPTTLTTILERTDPFTDLYIFSSLSLDTLDYTGPKLNHGSRAVLLGLGEKKRDLPSSYQGALRARAFCPGCLVVEFCPYEKQPNPDILLSEPSLQNWPLVVVVDNAAKALKNTASFLWTAFTRHEPAADIYARNITTYRHHFCYTLPLLIDARMKPSYPPEVRCDEKTFDLVTKRWTEYFPKGQEMGNSDCGHVC